MKRGCLTFLACVAAFGVFILLYGGVEHSNWEPDEGTRSPSRTRAGSAAAVTVAPNIDIARATLATRIAQRFLTARSGEMPSRLIMLAVDHGAGGSEPQATLRAVGEGLARRLPSASTWVGRRLGNQYEITGPVGAPNPSDAWWIYISETKKDDSTGIAAIVNARSTAPAFDISIVITPDAQQSAAPVARGETRLEFRSLFAGNAEDAMLDARVLLAEQIRDEVARVAVSAGRIRGDDIEEFSRRLDAGFSDETLIGQGSLSIKPVETGEGEERIIESWVSWRAQEDHLRTIASATADGVQLDRRMPYFKFALGVGAALLCILLWFRVDWWLKGRWPLATKVLFVILFAVACGLITQLQP